MAEFKLAPFPTTFGTIEQKRLEHLTTFWGQTEKPTPWYTTLERGFKAIPQWATGPTGIGGAVGRWIGERIFPESERAPQVAVPTGRMTFASPAQREQWEIGELQRSQAVSVYFDSFKAETGENDLSFVTLLQLRNYAGSPVKSVDEFLERFPIIGGVDLNEAERAWVQDVLDRVSSQTPEEAQEYLATQAQGEESVYVTPEGEEAELSELMGWMEERKESDYELRRLFRSLATFCRNEDEILNAFIRLYGEGKIPGLPEGLTEEDLQELMSTYTSGATEVLTEIPAEVELDLESQLDDIEAMYQEQTAEIGKIDHIPPPSIMTIIKQPFLGVFEVLNIYLSNISRPIAGMVLVAVAKIAQQTAQDNEILRLWNESRTEEDAWHAFGTAFENSSLNPALKFFFEVAVDPLTYVGVGLIPKIGAKLGRPGRFVARMDAGFAEMMNVPFDALYKGVGKLPKMPVIEASMTGVRARASMSRFFSWRAKTLGVTARKMPPDQIRQSLRLLMESGGKEGAPDIMKEAYKHLIVAEGITKREVLKLSDNLGGRFKTVADITDAELDNIYSALERILAGGPARATALDELVVSFGVTASKASKALLKKGKPGTTDIAEEWVIKYLGRTEAFIERIMKPTRGAKAVKLGQVLDGMEGKVIRETRAFLEEPLEKGLKECIDIGKKRMQRGALGSVILWSTNRFFQMGAVKFIDKVFVKFPAAMYLGFSGYFVFNVAEYLARPIISGRLPSRVKPGAWKNFEDLVAPQMVREKMGVMRGLELLDSETARAFKGGESARNWWKDWGVDVFITGKKFRVWSEKTGVMPAGYWVKQTEHYLGQMIAAEPVLGKIFKSSMENLDNIVMDRAIRQAIKGELVTYLRRGDAAGIRAMMEGNVDDVLLKEIFVERILQRYELSTVSPALVRDAMKRGTMFDEIDDLYRAALDAEQFHIISSPEYVKSMYDQLLSDFEKFPLTTVDDCFDMAVRGRLLELQYGSMPGMIFEEAHGAASLKASNAAKDKIWTDAFARSKAIMDVADSAMDVLTKRINTRIQQLTKGATMPKLDYGKTAIKIETGVAKDVDQAVITNLLDGLPFGIETPIGRITVKKTVRLSGKTVPAKTSSYKGDIRIEISEEAIRGKLFYSGKVVSPRDVVHHEVGHAIMAGDRAAKLQGAFYDELKTIFKRQGKFTTGQMFREEWAVAFSSYSRGTMRDRELLELFEKRFPRAQALKLKTTTQDALENQLRLTTEGRELQRSMMESEMGFRDKFFLGRKKSDMTSEDWRGFYQELQEVRDRFRPAQFQHRMEEWLNAFKQPEARQRLFKTKCQRDFTADAYIDPAGLAEIMGVHPTEMKSSILNNAFLQSEDDFTAMVMAYARTRKVTGVTEAKVRDGYRHIWTDSANITDPAQMKMVTLRQGQVDLMFKELRYLSKVKVMPKKLRAQIGDLLEDTAKQVDAHATPEVQHALNLKAQEAADKATRDLYRTFPKFGDEDALSQSMRFVFPYWNYEWQRIPYLFRLGATKPGVPLSWAKYTEHTDRGYIRIPGSDLEINLLRGTVGMGGMWGLLTDFPEFQDEYAGFMEGYDLMNRWGFYPNFMLMMPFSTVMSKSYPQTGQLIPTPWKTLWSIAEQVPAVGDELSRYRQTMGGGDRFVDYSISGLAAEVCQQRRLPYTGTDILGNVRDGDITPFTRNKPLELALLSEDSVQRANAERLMEQTRIWEEATKQFARYDILMEQMGCLRIYTENREKARDDYQEIIQKITGLTPNEQRTVYRRGFRIAEIMGRGYTPAERELINATEYRQYWAGLTTPLKPYSQQLFFQASAEMEREYRQVRQRLSGEKAELDILLFDGGITFKEWENRVKDIEGQEYNLWDNLRDTHEEWALLPNSMKTRMELFEEFGLPQYAPSFQDQLLELYFDLEAPKVTDVTLWGDEYERTNWDALYMMRRRIEEVAEEWGVAEEFKETIRSRYATPMDALEQDITEGILRSYWDMDNLIMLQYFTPDEHEIIKQYKMLAGQDPVKREALLGVVRADGKKLISQYHTMLREAREWYRTASPQVDYWLWFFGHTEVCKTPEALKMIQDWGRDLRKIPGYKHYLTNYPIYQAEAEDMGIQY